MSRKEIQEQRMKDYFIQATKEILKGEGIQALSVRSIAEKAGYSFATLYNYFKDVKELIFLCVKDFQQECQEYVEDKTKDTERGEKKIIATAISYAEYFVQYPSVFEIFFIEKLPNSAENARISELIFSFLEKLCQEEFQYCIDQKSFTAEEVKEIVKELNCLITGVLLLYLNRNYPSDYGDFAKNLKLQVEKTMKK
ncbi:TetR family transcriptional regulator [Flavobacterium anhuiense]|uniref:TetR family transcriptional regulator n=1 Tax=Flavobacterium anhuiense TaxID=459526 RepID=A0A444W3H8_9FLAO|nr:TetR/AcrR family transcriptional regulator [Flavobacterium anhuiense]RYJ40198.1 TetR family transcriptional regulator [Flavobacterium anhuiense]